MEIAQDYFEITVQRVGNVASGYAVRIAVCVLSALACRTNKRAWISFMGCGICWSIVELLIAVAGNRVGLMTLSGRMRYAAALVRGFSEGAAVAGCALVPYSPYTIAAAIVILFDAAVVYEGAMFVSKRVVYSTTSNAYIGTILISALWCFWRPKKGAYPADAMWLMTAFGFAWNAFAMMSGARVVTPQSYTLAFALYDALFEIGLLYAALSQIALYAIEVLWEDQPVPVKAIETDKSATTAAPIATIADDLKSFKAQLFAEANPWTTKLSASSSSSTSTSSKSQTALFQPIVTNMPRESLAPVCLIPWSANGQPRSRGNSDENFRRTNRSLSLEENGGSSATHQENTFKHPAWYPRTMIK